MTVVTWSQQQGEFSADSLLSRLDRRFNVIGRGRVTRMTQTLSTRETLP